MAAAYADPEKRRASGKNFAAAAAVKGESRRPAIA
jgi:hypothetical protein